MKKKHRDVRLTYRALGALFLCKKKESRHDFLLSVLFPAKVSKDWNHQLKVYDVYLKIVV